MISGKWGMNPKLWIAKNQAFYMDAMGDHGITNSTINTVYIYSIVYTPDTNCVQSRSIASKDLRQSHYWEQDFSDNRTMEGVPFFEWDRCAVTSWFCEMLWRSSPVRSMTLYDNYFAHLRYPATNQTLSWWGSW